MTSETTSGAMPASAHILAFRKTLLAGLSARAALAAIFVIGLGMLALRLGHAPLAAVMVAGAGGTFAALTYRSMRVSRDARHAAEQLASGELDDAERLLATTLRSFSLYPSERVVELYHLAMLRQSKGQHAEACELAAAVVGRRAPAAVAIASRLVLAESALEAGHLRAAHATIVDLMRGAAAPGSRALNLDESMRLLAIRCRYEAAVGAWDHLLHELSGKLRLIALMSPLPHACSTLCLARAARERGRPHLAAWLTARAGAATGREVWAECERAFAEKPPEPHGGAHRAPVA